MAAKKKKKSAKKRAARPARMSAEARERIAERLRAVNVRPGTGVYVPNSGNGIIAPQSARADG